MIRVLVTGPTGFIGTHCLKLLAARGCDELHAINRLGGPKGHEQTGLKEVRWHAGDMSRPEVAAQVIERIRPTHVLHCAWIATPGVYAQAEENHAWLAAGVAMFDAFAAMGGRRLVGVGSGAEYETSETRCREDETALRPSTVYGTTKAHCGRALLEAAGRQGFSAAWGRVFLPYGPGDPQQRLIPSVLAALRSRRPIALSDCAQVRDFIFAPDAAALLVTMLFADAGGAFNVGTGVGSKLRSVLELLADRVGGRECLGFGQLPMRPGEPHSLVADMQKVSDRFGWQPQTTLSDGLDTVLRGGRV